MTAHQVSSFNHGCLQMPINHVDRRPVACFERPASNIRFQKEAIVSAPMENCKETASSTPANQRHLSPGKPTSDVCSEKNVFCMADFFESIPDYSDINHLSEHEFYGKLDVLKRKQAQLNEACFRPPHRDVDEVPRIRVNSCDLSTHDGVSGEKSKRFARSKSVDSVRLPSCPSRISECDEEHEILAELIAESRCTFRTDEPVVHSPAKKTTSRKTHKVPATSKYPMYDQIVADQEKRSQLVKLNSMLELQSKIKPFRFATDKPKPQPLTNEDDDDEGPSVLYTPTPDPFAYQAPAKPKRFRARPCPRKLFSNYFYHKQWEEEQFRALNHRLRADELLQMSMRKTGAQRRKSTSAAAAVAAVPAQSDRSQSASSSTHRSRRRSSGKRAAATSAKRGSRDFITTCPHPFRFETSRRSADRKSADRTPSADTAASHSGQSGSQPARRSPQFLRSTPLPIYPAARPNLAANLRAEWSRKKICELTCGAEAAVAAEGGSLTAMSTNRRPSWGVRKMPGWKSLYYDHSNAEDISLRLSTRRAEERLRHEEHAISMELMRQRVRATPLLLEGATILPTTATAGIHRLRCNSIPAGHALCTADSGRLRPGRAQTRSSIGDHEGRTVGGSARGGLCRARSFGGQRSRSGRSTAETAEYAGSEDSRHFR